MKNNLENIKDLEHHIEKWMIDDCDDSLLFSNYYMNNRLFLTVSNKMKFSSISILILFYLIMYFVLNYFEMPISIYEYGKSIINGYRIFIMIVMSLIFENIYIIEYGAIILLSLYIGYQVYMFYQSVMTCIDHYNKCNTFTENYMGINRFIHFTKLVRDKDIKFNYFKYSDKIDKSLEFLDYYFSNDSSLGFSLVSKLSLDSYTKHINILCNYIGSIDMWIGIVDLLKINNDYSIPFYITSEKPIINITDMWNPVIKTDSIIKNSIKINNNLVIITGPNKAGKSTFMRTLLLSIYLSQSIGITCASYLEFTPFIELFTYINIPDSIGRESLFEAEINRCFEYLHKVGKYSNNNPDKKFTFGLVDELFTGTNPKEGIAGSHSIVNKLKNINTCITMLSTHFTDICKISDSNIKFIKFIAIKNEKNKYIFPYKTYNGISDQFIALELLKEKGFSNSIVMDALNYINHKN